jgi:hypothetical protein
VKVGKSNVDLSVPYGDPLYDGLDDGALLGEGKLGPSAVEILGLGDDRAAFKVLDGQEVDLPVQARDLTAKLSPSLLQWSVPRSEACRRQLPVEVEASDLLHLGGELLPFPLQTLKENVALGELPVSLGEVRGHFVGREDESPELLGEDLLQVHDGNLVAAALADILRSVTRHVHLLPAGTEGDSGEELGRPLGYRPPVDAALLQESVALIPQLDGDDGGNIGPDPIRFRLRRPVLLVPEAFRVVGPAPALGGRVTDEPLDGRVSELRPAAGTVSGIIQEPGNCLEAAVFQKKFVQEFADRSLFGMGNELAVKPLVYGATPPSGLPSLARTGTEAATRAAIISRSHWPMAAVKV